MPADQNIYVSMLVGIQNDKGIVVWHILLSLRIFLNENDSLAIIGTKYVETYTIFGQEHSIIR